MIEWNVPKTVSKWLLSRRTEERRGRSGGAGGCTDRVVGGRTHHEGPRRGHRPPHQDRARLRGGRRPGAGGVDRRPARREGMNKAAIPPAESVSRRGGATEVSRPTAGCLFSGMGGFASGLIKAGFSIRWASDNDEFACAAFRHRLPEVPLVEKDVRELSVQSDGLNYVDVLAAGFPCQSFSQAGSRLGFEDERGKLFFEIPRIVNEFKPADRPRLLILENVPHLLYGAKRLWFDQVRRSLRRAGYWFREDSCWTVNVKDATELPQDRERLFMVAALRTHFQYNPFSPSSLGVAEKNDCRPPQRSPHLF